MRGWIVLCNNAVVSEVPSFIRPDWLKWIGPLTDTAIWAKVGALSVADNLVARTEILVHRGYHLAQERDGDSFLFYPVSFVKSRVGS
jgi:hypothetical protein